MPVWVQKSVRNFYILSTTAFVLWMSLFDGNDFLSQFKNWSRLQEAYAELAYYDQKIEEVAQDRIELFSDPKMLEKFAREKYLMKKPKEDLYLIVEQ